MNRQKLPSKCGKYSVFCFYIVKCDDLVYPVLYFSKLDIFTFNLGLI